MAVPHILAPTATDEGAITSDLVGMSTNKRRHLRTAPSDVAEVLELERELQDGPECRRDQARVLLLLADDFVVIGASGT